MGNAIEMIAGFESAFIKDISEEKSASAPIMDKVEILLWAESLRHIVNFVQNNDLLSTKYRNQLVCLWTAHCIRYGVKSGLNHERDFQIIRTAILDQGCATDCWTTQNGMIHDLDKFLNPRLGI